MDKLTVTVEGPSIALDLVESSLRDSENIRLVPAEIFPGYEFGSFAFKRGEPDAYIASEEMGGEKMYLVCKGCGEACDTMQTAHEHGAFLAGPDPHWCGENGFDLVAESEAF